MKQAAAVYLAPLTSFGPLFMVIGQSRPSGDIPLISLLLGVLPIIGAGMVGIAITLILRIVLTQQKELAELRTKLEVLEQK